MDVPPDDERPRGDRQKLIAAGARSGHWQSGRAPGVSRLLGRAGGAPELDSFTRLLRHTPHGATG